MAELHSYTCDQCGAMKKEANHWFKAYVLTEPNVGVVIVPAEFEAPGIVREKRLDLCSHSCVSKLVSKVLGDD